jgi:hypothetical protein
MQTLTLEGFSMPVDEVAQVAGTAPESVPYYIHTNKENQIQMTQTVQTEQRFIFKGYNRHAFYQELNCFSPTYKDAWNKFQYMHPNFMILTVDNLGDWED